MGILFTRKGQIVPEDDNEVGKEYKALPPNVVFPRQCRDIGFLLAFALLWALNILIGIQAITYGDPQRLV